MKLTQKKRMYVLGLIAMIVLGMFIGMIIQQRINTVKLMSFLEKAEGKIELNIDLNETIMVQEAYKLVKENKLLSKGKEVKK